MVGDIVNLNKARKAKRKADAAQQADANRVRFGLPKAVRDADAKAAQKADSALDGKKLDQDQ